MERELYNWCINQIQSKGKPLSRGLIKQRARNLSRFQGSFKASKGWLDKFIKRYELSSILRAAAEKNKERIFPSQLYGSLQYSSQNSIRGGYHDIASNDSGFNCENDHFHLIK